MSRPHTCMMVEVGALHGLGHLVRCGILAHSLAERGHRVDLHLYGSIRCEHVSTFLPAHAAIRLHESSSRGAEEPKEIPASIDTPYSWVVLDGYSFTGSDWLTQARAVGASLMVIDDLGDRTLDADLVLNQNSVTSSPYGTGQVCAKRYLLGPRYALVSYQYALVGQQRTHAPTIGKLLIAFGGADRLGCTTKAMEVLSRCRPELSIDVVVGPFNSARGQIDALAATAGSIAVHVAPSNLEFLFGGADMLVSACGSTVWQAFAAACPTIGVITASNQKWVAHALSACGGEVLQPDQISSELVRAVEDLAAAPARERLAMAEREWVDGLGPLRVADAMEEFLMQRNRNA